MTGIVTLLSQARGRPLSCLEDLGLRLAARRLPARIQASQALATAIEPLADAVTAEVLKLCPADTEADALADMRNDLLREVRDLIWALTTAIREGSADPTLLRAIRDQLERSDSLLSAARRGELALLALQRLGPEHVPSIVTAAWRELLPSAVRLIQQAEDARWLLGKHRWLADATMRRVSIALPEVGKAYGEGPTTSKGKRDAEYLLEELASLMRSAPNLEASFASYLAREVFPFTQYPVQVYRVYLTALAEAIATAGKGKAGRSAAEVLERLVDRVDSLVLAAELHRSLDSLEGAASRAVERLGPAAQRGVHVLLDGLAELIAGDRDHDPAAVSALWCDRVCPQLPFVLAKDQGALLKACMAAGQRQLKGDTLRRFLKALQAVSGVARRLSWVAAWFGHRDELIAAASPALGATGASASTATKLCASLLDEALLGLPPADGHRLRAVALLEINVLEIEPAVVEAAASALAAEIVKRGSTGASELAAALGTLNALQADLLQAHAIRSSATASAEAAAQAGAEADSRYANPVAQRKAIRDLTHVVNACADALVAVNPDHLHTYYAKNVFAQLRPGAGAQAATATIRALASSSPGAAAAPLSKLADRVPALAAGTELWRNAEAYAEQITEGVFNDLPDYAEKVGDDGRSKANQDLATGLRCVARSLSDGVPPEESQTRMHTRVLSYLRTFDPKLIEVLHAHYARVAQEHLDPLSYAAAEPHLTTLYDSLTLEDELCPAP